MPGRSRARTALVALLLPAAMVVIARLWIARLPGLFRPETLDRFFLYGPFHDYLGRQLAQGRLPGWNPWLGLGINDASDVSLGPFYLPNAIFALLPVAPAEALLIVAHIAMAATAVFLLARRCALGVAGAAVGAAFVASGVIFNHLANYASLLMTFCWCPVVFLAGRRLADRPSAAAALLLAGALAMQIFAGYLQVHLYTLFCLPLFFLPLARDSAGRVILWTIAAESVALSLSAVTLLGGLTAIAVSWRSREATPALAYTIFPVYPHHYWLSLGTPTSTRSPVYGGPLLAPLVVAGIAAAGAVPRLRIPAVIILLAAVFLSFGEATPIFPLLWRLPIGHWFTGPYKWTYFAALGALLVAAVGAHALLTRGALHRVVVAGWLVASLLYLYWLPGPPAMRAAAAAIVVCLAIAQRRAVPRLRVAIALLLAPAVMVTALAGYRYRSKTLDENPAFYGRYRPAYAYLAERQADGRVFVLMASYDISPRQGEMEGVAQLNTNGVIVTQRYARYFGEVLRGVNGSKRGRGLALLRAVGGRFIMTRHNDYRWLERAGLERVFTSRHADVWRDDRALPRAYVARVVERLPAERVIERLRNLSVPDAQAAVLEVEEGAAGNGGTAGEAHIVRSSDTEVVVSVDVAEPGVLVLLDAWSPDWRAWVDGRRVPIRHANWLARAVDVPAGRHEVVFAFVPVTLYVGLAISAATALGCLVAVVVLARRRAAEPA